MTTKKNNLWGGRFNEPTDKFVKIFNASVDFDKTLALYDIKGSQAHANMLYEIKVLSKEELKSILAGLDKIKIEIEKDKFNWSLDLEDVHMNIESRLIEICGDTGKKIHTGRSRNDQVATDVRLYLRDQVKLINSQILELLNEIITLAEKEQTAIMPGFTHLQAAQPISFAHHMLAYFEMFTRDHERLKESYKRINTMPLGAAALAGSSYAIDRHKTAKILAFERVCNNSIDAVSDRDFAIEFCANSSLIMMHLSRLCEELILWSSAQFDFINLPDNLCTGSSIMPQKKNPDIPELVRGKTGRVNGNLIALLTIMKAQPLAYNKDNQEDKEPLFDTVNTITDCLHIMTKIISEIQLKHKNMLSSAMKGYTTATDLADYLVKKDIPFRKAHKIVGEIVLYAIKNDKNLTDLTLEQLQRFEKSIKQDIFAAISLEGSINSRDIFGGTSIKQIAIAIQEAKKNIAK